jgi:hypothetical protein
LVKHQRPAVAKERPVVAKGKGARRQSSNLHPNRNMSRYPIVLKDYVFPSYFAERFRYNGQALVYSGLLACGATFACESAALRLKDRP